MLAGSTIFEVLRVIFLGLSPVILLLGLFILLSNPEKYNKLETNLGKEIGGIRKKIIPPIETDINVFQNWLMKKRTILGLFCIICAVIFFFLLRR